MKMIIYRQTEHLPPLWAAGLPDRFHDLRHSLATMLLSAKDEMLD